MKVYDVPKSIADSLCISKYRLNIEDRYLLSSDDLQPYGIDQAIQDGAKETTIEQFKNKKS
jgi:hypothetical protein